MKNITATLLFTGLLATSAQAIIIYSDDFIGDGTGFLNGETTTTGGGTWTANDFVNTDGSFTETNEGSATLGFTAAADGTVYTVTIDIANSTGNWVGVGFSTNSGGSGGSSFADRFSNNGGYAWMLFRNNSANNSIESFQGNNTGDGVAHGDALNSGINFNIANTLSVSIWADDNATTHMEWFINGTSIRTDDEAVDITTINNVGFTYDNTGDDGVSVDNFVFEAVPEPSSSALLGLGGLALILRRRK